jgi:pyrroline-5-carboxylate reductase
MGQAMLAGWIEAGLVEQAIVVDPNHFASPMGRGREDGGNAGHSGEGIRLSQSPHPSPLPGGEGIIEHPNRVHFISSPAHLHPAFIPDMVVLAVKPQVMADILPFYRRMAGQAPFLSIAAGKDIAFFERHLGGDAAIIRAMPNLPATIRMGTTGCCANERATTLHRALATSLLTAIGEVHWVEEVQIDALMALSGCGPAYVFLMAEVLAKAGEELGLGADLAASLARQTIAGAAEMLRRSSEPAATLRDRVTSKGGTTEAALRILMENDALFSIYARAMQSAVTRAGELAD